MANGADNDGQMAQDAMKKLFKDPRAAHAVYERAPNGKESIAASYNYSGDEDTLTKIITSHVNLLWTPRERLSMTETQTALFRHARAGAQRIEEHIYLTLAYPDDFSKRRNNTYADKRVGITAYSVHFPAEQKPTTENTRVKAFKDNIRTLFQLYNLSRPRLYPGKEEGQLTNDPDKVLTAAKGYDKLIILDDIVSQRQQVEPELEAPMREATEEELGFFDDSAYQKMQFPEPSKTDRKTPNPDSTPKKPAPEKPRRLYKVDLSKLVQLNIPPVLEEKNGFFDSLFMHVTQLHGEYEAGKIFETDKAKFERDRATVYALKDLCFRTQTGPDGNLCYIVTPESLEALRQATLSALVTDGVKNLAAAYGRIAMRAKNLWALGRNAREITDQRDSLAAEVSLLRKTARKPETDTIFTDEAPTVAKDAHADLRYQNVVRALSEHLQSSERTKHLLAFGQRVTTEYQARSIDDPLIPKEIRTLAEGVELLGKYLEEQQDDGKKDQDLIHDAEVVRGIQTKVVDPLLKSNLAAVKDVKSAAKPDELGSHISQLLAYASRKAPRPKEIDPRFKPIYDAFDGTVKQLVSEAKINGKTDGKKEAKEELEERIRKLEERAVKAEKELNEARRAADKFRVEKEQTIEKSTKNYSKLSDEHEALKSERDRLQKEKDEAVGKSSKLAADYKSVVKLFTELEQEVRDALEGDV